ncbi:MAG TPA: hypothetical protein VGF94_27245 [Kofleriaceae bacterium]
MRNILLTLVLGSVIAVAGTANAGPRGGGHSVGGGHFGGGHAVGGSHFGGHEGGGRYVGHEGWRGGGGWHEGWRGGWRGPVVGVGVGPAYVEGCDPYYYDCGEYAPSYVEPGYVEPRVVVRPRYDGPRYAGPRVIVRHGWRR